MISTPKAFADWQAAAVADGLSVAAWLRLAASRELARRSSSSSAGYQDAHARAVADGFRAGTNKRKHRRAMKQHPLPLPLPRAKPRARARKVGR